MAMQELGRRKFLKLTGGAASGIALGPFGCTVVYEKGIPVARSTDGKIDDGVALYYITPQSVQKYDSEIADVVNEIWVREFNQGIDRHITIQFVGDAAAACGCESLGCYKTDQHIDWSRLEKIRKKEIIIEKGLTPYRTTLLIAHELGHQMDSSERISELTDFRYGVKSNFHFPQFGQDTSYKLLDAAYLDIEGAKQAFWPEIGTTRHVMGKLAALFALNLNGGSFETAHAQLILNPGYYSNRANEFVDNALLESEARGPISATRTLFDKTTETINVEYWRLAFSDLMGVVTHQIIKQYLPSRSPETATTLEKELQKNAFTHSCNIYNAKIKNPDISYPQDYDYSIPAGIGLPEPEDPNPGPPNGHGHVH